MWVPSSWTASMSCSSQPLLLQLQLLTVLVSGHICQKTITDFCSFWECLPPLPSHQVCLAVWKLLYLQSVTICQKSFCFDFVLHSHLADTFCLKLIHTYIHSFTDGGGCYARCWPAHFIIEIIPSESVLLRIQITPTLRSELFLGLGKSFLRHLCRLA